MTVRFHHLDTAIGACPRRLCGNGMATNIVRGDDDRILFSCDSERCLARAVELVRAGHGV